MIKEGYIRLSETLERFGLSLLSVIAFLALFLMPSYLPNAYFLSVMVLSIYTGILGMGFDFSVGFIGVANWGYAGLTGLGAYTSALLLMKLGVSPWIGIVIAGLVCALMGALIGLLTLSMNAVFTSIVSWFMGLLLMALAISMPGLTRGSMGLNVDQFFDTPWPQPYFRTIVIIAFVVFVGLRLIVRSKYGLAFRAIGQDYEAARSSGVKVVKYKLMNFTISCFIAGLCGGFYAHFLGIVTPNLMATGQLITVLVVAYLGGRGSIWGALVAAIVLGPALEFMNGMLEYKFILYGVMLVVVMIFYPGGVAQLYSSIFEKFGNKRQQQELSAR